MDSLDSYTQTIDPGLNGLTAKDFYLKNTYLFLSSTSRERQGISSIPFQRRVDMQTLPRCSTQRIMGKFGFFSTSTQTVTRSVR
ncbi:hypothetical protein BYT27DRAFT_7197432 [Phlegmacium glaucopus]|nr:hypothetical protein BYT27DRAFT_7197432 [Phlegmacium glaucopus]